MDYNKEYAKKVYAGLKKRGYTDADLGEEELFVTRMGREENRRYLYDLVTERGDANIGSWERFNTRMTEQPTVESNGVIPYLENLSGIPYPQKELDKSQYTFTSSQLGIEEPKPVVSGKGVRGLDLSDVERPYTQKQEYGQTFDEAVENVEKFHRMRYGDGGTLVAPGVYKDGDVYRTAGGTAKKLTNANYKAYKAQVESDITDMMALYEQIGATPYGQLDTSEWGKYVDAMELGGEGRSRGARKKQEWQNRMRESYLLPTRELPAEMSITKPKGYSAALRLLPILSLPEEEGKKILGEEGYNALKFFKAYNERFAQFNNEAEEDAARLGFAETMAQGFESMGRGAEYFFGESYNAFNGSALDDKAIIDNWDEFFKDGKLKDSMKGYGDVYEDYREYIKKLLEENDNDVAKVKGIIKQRSTEVTQGDWLIQNANEAMNSFNPEMEGALGLVAKTAPQLVGVLAAIVSGGAGAPALGSAIGVGNMGYLTASTMGQSMKEARDAGATNLETWLTGIADGAIELVTEKIPFDNWTKGILRAGKGKIAGELVESMTKNPAAREEFELLLKRSRKELDIPAFSGNNIKKYLAGVAAEGASEFTAEALQTLTKRIYENPEDYPTIMEAIKNGWEGAKAGLLMGAVTGAVVTSQQRRANDARRKKQGFVEVASLEIGGRPYIGEIVGKTNDGGWVVTINGEDKVVKSGDIKDKVTFSYEEFRTGEIMHERQMAFDEGYSQEPTGEAAVNNIGALEAAENEVRRMLGLANDANIDVEVAKFELTDEEAKAVDDYRKAKARFEGTQQRFQETRDAQYAESDRSIDERSNKRNPAMVYSTMYDGQQVYITDGDVVLNEDGTIDYNNSSEALYITYPDGHAEQVSVSKFIEKVNAGNTEELKAQERAQIDQNWRNEFDTAEISAAEQEKRKKGLLFNLTDGVGAHTIEVLEEGADDSKILFDGKEMPISTDELNQWRAEAGITQAKSNENVGESAQPVQSSAPAVAPIPIEKRGKEERAAYHLAPIERTLEDLHDGALEPNEITALINARIKEAYNDVQALEKKKPTEPKKPVMGASKEAYLVAKAKAKADYEKAQAEWQTSMDEAQQRLNYYNELYAREQEITKSEIKEAYDNVQLREVVEMTADEFIANNLPKITPGSFKAETGLSNSEQAELVGYIAGEDKGGVSVERAAEIIMESYGDELRGLGFQGDMQDVRDIIIDILSQGNPRSYAKSGIEQRRKDSINQQRAEIESVAALLGFESVEEWVAYEEQVIPGIIQMYTGFDYNEYYNNLAENYEYDTTREGETVGRGGELLQGEQPVDNTGAPVVGGNEGGAVPDSVQSDGANAQAPGDQQVSSEVNTTLSQTSDQVSDQVAEGGASGQSGVVGNNSANALQNGNNELNLQKENESNNESNQNDIPVGGQVPQSVPQGEYGENAAQVGGAQETAARLRERIESTQGDSKSGLREVENRVTREFAQDNGLWIENEFKLGVPFPSGDEHNNYIDAENQVVYKVNNRMHTPSILDLLDRIEQHNKYFPNTQYRLVGFTSVSENGDVMPVFAQGFVPDARMATVDEIDSYMGTLGFTRVGDGRYSNGEVVIKDLKPRNVLADADGDIYVVDAEFEQENAEKSGEIAENGGEVTETTANPTDSETTEQPETNEVANAGPVNMDTLQLNMSDEDFNALLNSGDKTAISEYLAEMDGLLRIGVGSPLDGQEALREEYRKAVEQYGKENIPAEVMDDLNSRMQPYSDLSRAIFDRKYALQDRLREIEATEQRAKELAEKEAKAEHKQTAFGGFLAGKTDLGASAAEKALNKKYDFDGKVMTVAEFVEEAVGNGDAKLSTIEEPKYKGASRAAWNRMDARQQEADAKRVKESGTKTIYTVNDHDLGKTAYDYAKFLLDKKAEQEKADAKQMVKNLIQPFAKEKAAEQAAVKIEDVGEKIGGARKDRFAEGMARIKADLEETDETLMDKLAKLPVSQVFNFDLEKLREGGISNDAISFIKIVKDYLPAKPRKTHKIRSWVNNTLALYKLCLEAGTNWDRVNTLLNGPQFASSSLKEQFDAYMAIGGFDSGMNIGDAKLRQLDNKAGRYDANGNFVSIEGKWYVRDAGKHGGIYDTKEEAVNALKAFAGDKAGVTSSGKKKEVKFAVYQRRQDKSIFIAVKGKSDIVIQDGFASSKEAFDYIEANNAELQERYRALLDKTNADFEDNRPREGRDYRDGKDIPAEEFRTTFGFRGVEFGNWMTQEDRRKALNECYDALMDLAAVCKVSPQALSLGGTLGMAFGARGGGRFSAHYEPGKLVINLTKTKGAGSLAHEWFHALDNYFAKMGSNSLDVYATAGEGLSPEGVRSIGKRYYDRNSGQMLTEEEYNERMNSHDVRREMADAWKSLMETLKKSDYYKRSLAYAGLHNSNYWSRPTELGARAFSTWVENELSKQGASNDYLANNPRFLVSEATDAQSRFMPYPFDADATWMEEAFGNLFATLEEKTTEDGNVVLYRSSEEFDREGAGPLTDREVVMESDVYSKVLGKPRYYGQKQRNYVARQRAKMAQKATELAEKLNTPIEVRETAEGLTGKKAKAKGWYDVKSGNIVVVVSNHGSIEDIQATVLHEVEAHKGLRQMFGEHFDAFLDNVYNNVDAETRAKIVELSKKYNGDSHTATEEYLASLAEETNFEKVNPTLWERIKAGFMQLLANVGIKLDFELSDNELRYILWRSYQNLVAPDMYNNVFAIAENIAKQYELGVGDYAPTAQGNAEAAESETRFRTTGETIENQKVAEGASEEIRFRKMNYDEAVQEAKNFEETHKGSAPIVVLDGIENWESEFIKAGVKKDEIERFRERLKTSSGNPKAAYLDDADLIFIFKPKVDEKDFNGYIWHENIHKAIREDDREGIPTLESALRKIFRDDFDATIKEAEEHGYIGEEAYEEIACQLVQSAYLMDRMNSNGLKGRGVFQDFINPLIKKIYGRGRGIVHEGVFEESNRANEKEFQGGSLATTADRRTGGGSETETQATGAAEGTRFRIVEKEKLSPEEKERQRKLKDNAKAIRRLHNVKANYPITALRNLGFALETQEQREMHDRLFAERDAISGRQNAVSAEVNPQSMTLMERITESLLKVAEQNKDNVELRLSAIRAYGRDLANVIKLMRAQRGYDRNTVNMFVSLAKMYLRNNAMSGMSSYDISRLLGLISRANGGYGPQVVHAAEQIAEIITKSHTRELEDIVRKQIKTGAEKVNASGVVVQGGVDVVGKRVLNTFRDAINMTSEEEFEKAFREAFEKATKFPNDVEAKAACDAMVIAKEYRDNIVEAKKQESELLKSINQYSDIRSRYDRGEITRREYNEFVDAVRKSLIELRSRMVDNYQRIIHALGGDISEGIKRAKEFRERELARVEKIHNMAEADMSGVSKSAERKKRGFWRKATDYVVFKNPLAKVIAEGLGTYNEFMKFFGRNAIGGKGRLYDYFIGRYTEVQNQEWVEKQKDIKKIDERCEMVFGKGFKDVMRDSEKNSGVVLEYWNGGERVSRDLSIGQLMYIYMTAKQTDGEMKLRGMGITEETVNKAVAVLPARYKVFADWVQSDFLPEMRPRLNEVHKRMFGASMSEVKNYFPLVVNTDARQAEVDLNSVMPITPSTITGSIIKRKVNATPLNLESNAFDVLLNHVSDMEHWAAFAEFTRDNNTLIGDKDFMNRVKNSRGLRFGDGEAIWNNFVETARITTGNYRAKKDEWANVMKGVSSAKITFGYYTALKQFLSSPALWLEASTASIIKATVNPLGSWRWAIENLPGFEERWKGRTAGNERLADSDSDWSIWDNRLVKAAREAGMAPNAFVDAVVVSTGARAVYDSRKRFYKALGLSQEEQHKRALKDAAVAYNETQQSAQGAYLSILQKEGGFKAMVMTLYRNSQMAYSRKVTGSMAELYKKAVRWKAILDNEEKKYLEMGLSEKDAKEEANKALLKSASKDVATLVMFGYVLNMVWYLGEQLPYLLFGDDEEEKEKIMDTALKIGATGMFEGFALGNVAKDLYVKGATGNRYSSDMLTTPFASDAEKIINRFANDGTLAGMSQLLILGAETFTGISPQRLIDDAAAVIDFCNGDLDKATEVTLLTTRLAKVPQSQIDKLYLEEALGGDVVALAERYAEYKRLRDYPLNIGDDKILKKYAERFKKAHNEDLKEIVKDENAYEGYFSNASPEEKIKLTGYRGEYLEELTGKKAEEVLTGRELIYYTLYGRKEQNLVYSAITTPDDVDDEICIEMMMSELKPILDNYPDGRASVEYEERYSKELNLLDALKKIERAVSQYKSDMKKNDNYADEYMTEIRKLRAEAIELINRYYNE